MIDVGATPFAGGALMSREKRTGETRLEGWRGAEKRADGGLVDCLGGGGLVRCEGTRRMRRGVFLLDSRQNSGMPRVRCWKTRVQLAITETFLRHVADTQNAIGSRGSPMAAIEDESEAIKQRPFPSERKREKERDPTKMERSRFVLALR